MALSPATVDERLAPGAADEGWHIIPKVHGTRKTLSYIYVAPCGVRFGSMQAARDSLHDGGAEALKAEQRIAAGENVTNDPSVAAAEAAVLQAAADEGLTLERSEKSKTGFKCVSYNKALGKKPFKLKVEGKDIGTFAVAAEAALEYARLMARRRRQPQREQREEQPLMDSQAGRGRGQKRALESTCLESSN